MVPHTILCHHRLRPEWRRLLSSGSRIWLSTDPRYGNVYLKPARLEESLGRTFDPLVLDLCEVGAYVYLADKAVSRGRYEKWVRDLAFHIPVREPARWNAVRTQLTNTVGTLSGDNVRFHFVKKHKPEQRRRPVAAGDRASESEQADCVSLFSGGLDSLAGAAHLVQAGRRPLLASHHASGLKSLQSSLAQRLGAELGHSFEHFQFRVTSDGREQTSHPFVSRENSHRARSFMFLSFAAAAAAARGLSEIFICENGVLSLNVPISEARKGTRSTHHAHPLYLRYFTDFVNGLFERRFEIHNPFFYWTKRQEIELLANSGLHELIRDTVSCWGYPQLTVRFPDSNHCGTCIPCLVRRVSMIAAGLEAHDDHYAADAFGSEAALSPKERRNVEDLVYFAERFVRSSKSDLLRHFPELVMVEVGPDGFPGNRLDAMIGVYQRFAEDILAITAERAPQYLSASRQAALVA